MSCTCKRIRRVKSWPIQHELQKRLSDIDYNFQVECNRVLTGTARGAQNFAQYYNSADQTTNLGIDDDIELDTEAYDDIGITLSSNSIALPTGLFLVTATITRVETTTNASNYVGTQEYRLHDGSSFIGPKLCCFWNTSSHIGAYDSDNAANMCYEGTSSLVHFVEGEVTLTLRCSNAVDNTGSTVSGGILDTVYAYHATIEVRQI